MTYDEGVAHCAASGSKLAAIYDTSELAAARAAISAAGVEKAMTSASSDGSGWAWHGTERWEEGGFPLNTGQVTDAREGEAGHIYSLHRSEDGFVWDADRRDERHPVLCRLPDAGHDHGGTDAQMCPITRSFCTSSPSLPNNCNCGDCGYPACGDCDCDFYGDTSCCYSNGQPTAASPTSFVVRPSPLELSPRHRPAPPLSRLRRYPLPPPLSPAPTPGDDCPSACTARRSPPRP